jgi:hypothetical protein
VILTRCANSWTNKNRTHTNSSADSLSGGTVRVGTSTGQRSPAPQRRSLLQWPRSYKRQGLPRRWWYRQGPEMAIDIPDRKRHRTGEKVSYRNFSINTNFCTPSRLRTASTTVMQLGYRVTAFYLYILRRYFIGRACFLELTLYVDTLCCLRKLGGCARLIHPAYESRPVT